MDMQIFVTFDDEWWLKLSPATRAGLMTENGDAVLEALALEVVSAGGPAVANTGVEDAELGLYLTDDIIGWVEK